MSLFSLFVSIYVRRSRLVLWNVQVQGKQKWAEDKAWALLEDELCTTDLIRLQLNSRGNGQGQEVWIWKKQCVILITHINDIRFCALGLRVDEQISNLHAMQRNFMVCSITETLESKWFIWKRKKGGKKRALLLNNVARISLKQTKKLSFTWL